MTPEFILQIALEVKDRADRELEHEREAWQLGDYIPSTYLEGGVRKIYVWDDGIETRYTYTPENGLKQVKEIF